MAQKNWHVSGTASAKEEVQNREGYKRQGHWGNFQEIKIRRRSPSAGCLSMNPLSNLSKYYITKFASTDNLYHSHYPVLEYGFASTSKLSSINTQSSRNLEIQARPVNTRLPSNCTASFKLNGESLEGSAWSTTPPDHRSQESAERPHTPIETSNFERNYPSRSSTSLASSFNTVIQLSTTSLADPAPTSEVAQGSFLESRSDSSQLLNEIVAKSIAENQSNSNPDALDSDELADSKAARIQFHNIVRISGGITSNPKRKRAKKQLPIKFKSIVTGRHRLTQTEQPHHVLLWDAQGLGRFTKTYSSHQFSSPVSPSRPGEPKRFDTRASLLFPHLSKTTDRTPYNSVHHPPDHLTVASLVIIPALHQPTTMRMHSLLSFVRLGGQTHDELSYWLIDYSATIISRSSSPASSLYLPSEFRSSELQRPPTARHPEESLASESEDK
ncbi:hypothetical protein KEM48_003647 [Puccinia striiformis f. sp. tritici PST-130]|nr:hypothetical protein KEM48_003647 [Puccinia striiformis f. sp. tritici PST-130]